MFPESVSGCGRNTHFVVILLLQLYGSAPQTIGSGVLRIVNLTLLFGIAIGLIALIKGDMVGWGIHSRKTAVIVLIVSLLSVFMMSFVAIFVY
jgi:hypothetical protein